ncbi:MAG: segregation/condensation protein A [Pseudomonadota bacterium]
MSEQSNTDQQHAAASTEAQPTEASAEQRLEPEAQPSESLDGTSASQTELPFAFVDGEPITELPKDLFIPPQALSVFLEAFEGPLDFLLYLIKRQNLDVLNIPIADISRQYTGYIDLMQDMQLELAGEYLVMAATLAEIKSRMLLPRPVSEEEDEGEDPRAELVRRLQEYERYKNAAERVDELPRMERENWPVSAPMVERTVVRKLPEVTLKEMVAAFGEVMSRAELNQHYHIRREALSVRERMTEILDNLRAAEFTEFRDLLRADQGKQGVVASFLAVLELAKESLIEIVQSGEFAPIHVRAAGSDNPQPAASDASTE